MVAGLLTTIEYRTIVCCIVASSAERTTIEKQLGHQLPDAYCILPEQAASYANANCVLLSPNYCRDYGLLSGKAKTILFATLGTLSDTQPNIVVPRYVCANPRPRCNLSWEPILMAPDISAEEQMRVVSVDAAILDYADSAHLPSTNSTPVKGLCIASPQLVDTFRLLNKLYWQCPDTLHIRLYIQDMRELEPIDKQLALWSDAMLSHPKCTLDERGLALSS